MEPRVYVEILFPEFLYISEACQDNYGIGSTRIRLDSIVEIRIDEYYDNAQKQPRYTKCVSLELSKPSPPIQIPTKDIKKAKEIEFQILSAISKLV